MSAANPPWSFIEQAELLDCIQKYKDTRGKRRRPERQQYYRRIAAEINHLRDRDRPQLSGEDVRNQCEELINTGAKIRYPKLENFLSKGREYLSGDYQFDIHVPVDAKPLSRSATVSPSRDLVTPIGERNGYRDRYELRPRTAGRSVSSQVPRTEKSPFAAESKIPTGPPRLFSETVPESTPSQTKPPVESKTEIPNLEELGDLDLEELDPRWSDYMYDQARLDTHRIPGRVSKLNRFLISLADYVKNLLPGLKVQQLRAAIENDELSTMNGGIALSSAASADERIDFQTSLRSVLAQAVKKWVFDARSPFPGSDLIAEEPLRRVGEVLCHKGAAHLRSVVVACLKDVYHGMTSSEEFRNVELRQKGQTLARDLIRLFYEHDADRDHCNDIASARREVSPQELNLRLEKLFDEALWLCAQLKQREEPTAVIWPLRGEAFDAESMRAQNVPEVEWSSNMRVQLTLMPMFAYFDEGTLIPICKAIVLASRGLKGEDGNDL